ncbi:MAG: hypothetical protein IT198_14925 [Acidimicrobiia bacterium]|nr:hypothetical protein [Acidimicrobiia bacterium]
MTITNCTPMGPATNTIMTMSGPGWSLVSGVVDAMSLDTDRTARGSFVVPEVAEGPPGEEFPSGVYRVHGGCGLQDQAFATVPDSVEFEVTDGPVPTTTVPEDLEETETQATEPGTVPTPAVADPAVTG